MERTQSVTMDDLEEARFELGRIVNINPGRGTVDFRSQMSNQDRIDIPYLMPYYDQYEGTGIYFNPEVGTTCICGTTSDGNSLIVGFVGVDENGSYLCGRPQGNPGDITITGRDGNFMHIRRGGIVQIGSKSICQTVYIPIRNILQHFCENFELYSLAGTAKFSVDRKEDSNDGKSKCRYTFTVNEFAQDSEPVVSISSGSLEDSKFFSLVSKNASGGSTTLSLNFSKDGSIELTTKKTIKISASDNIDITTEADATLKANNTNIKSNLQTKIDGNSTQIASTANTLITSQGTTSIQGANVRIDQGLFPVMRLSPDMVVFLGALAALVAAGGVTPPVLHVNPKVLV